MSRKEESHQFKSRCATCGVPDSEHPVKEVVFNGQVLKVWDHSEGASK